MKLNSRCFLKTTGAVGLGASNIWAQPEIDHDSQSKVIDSKKATISVIRIAQIKVCIKGARVIFNPTYGMHGDLNLCMMRTRSYENGIYIVFTHPGQALITDHRGAVVCNYEDDAKTYAITEIDLSKAPANKGGIYLIVGSTSISYEQYRQLYAHLINNLNAQNSTKENPAD